jgi:restriction system protein
MIIFGTTLDIPGPWIQTLRATWPLWAALGASAFLLRLPRLLKRADRTENPEAQEALKELQELTPAQFAAFCPRLFGKLGFEAETTIHGNDGRIDMVAVKGGHTYFVRCKHQPKINLAAVKDFYEAMAAAGCPRGFFCSTGAFAPDVAAFAAGKPIELIDGKQLIDYAEQLAVEISDGP